MPVVAYHSGERIWKYPGEVWAKCGCVKPHGPFEGSANCKVVLTSQKDWIELDINEVVTR